MLTILLLDDDAADRAVIWHTLAGTDHRLTEAASLHDFFDYLGRTPFDLIIMSLAAMPEERIADFHRLLARPPETKVLALAPFRTGDGLRTLLKAEALRAHHLLATPFDTPQFLSILNVTFPVSSSQD